MTSSAAADLPVSGDHRLDPAYVPLSRMAGAMATLAISVALLAVSPVAYRVFSVLLPGSPVPLRLALAGNVWLFASAVVAAFFYAWPAVEYRHMGYRVDDEGLEIRRGVFWRRVITVPRSRVQHTDVSQGPLERRFGLGTLVVYTAGTVHAKVALPGLNHARALAIRDRLLGGGAADGV